MSEVIRFVVRKYSIKFTTDKMAPEAPLNDPKTIDIQLSRRRERVNVMRSKDFEACPIDCKQDFMPGKKTGDKDKERRRKGN